jgi:hypothetical protein
VAVSLQAVKCNHEYELAEEQKITRLISGGGRLISGYLANDPALCPLKKSANKSTTYQAL